MFKLLFPIGVLLLVSACSSKEMMNDRQPASGSTNNSSTTLVGIRGAVSIGNQFKGVTEFLIRDATPIAAANSLNKQKVEQFVKAGFSVVIHDGSMPQVSSCREAVIVILAGEGNMIPNSNGTEVYKMPSIVNFSCINN